MEIGPFLEASQWTSRCLLLLGFVCLFHAHPKTTIADLALTSIKAGASRLCDDCCNPTSGFVRSDGANLDPFRVHDIGLGDNRHEIRF